MNTIWRHIEKLNFFEGSEERMCPIEGVSIIIFLTPNPCRIKYDVMHSIAKSHNVSIRCFRDYFSQNNNTSSYYIFKGYRKTHKRFNDKTTSKGFILTPSRAFTQANGY